MLTHPKPRHHKLLHAWADAEGQAGIIDDAAEDVVAALLGDEDVSRALGRFGRCRGSAGLTIAEVYRSLEGLRSSCPPALRRQLDRMDSASALAEGWAEGFLEGLMTSSCIDPLTGMTNLAFLRTRLDEVYLHCDALGLRACDVHAVVVVDPQLGQAPSLSRAGSLVEIAERVRRAFPAGETVSVTSSGRVLALVSRTPELPQTVLRLVRGVDGARRSWPVSAWVEPLPPRQEDLDSLLAWFDERG